jgi:hypothetical protein
LQQRRKKQKFYKGVNEMSMLDTLSEKAYKARLSEDYQKRMIAEGLEDQMKREALGIEIAGWCQWAGYDICEIFQAALEDANFHTLNQEISEAIARDKERR